jgi:hypothetical protein
MGWEVCDVVMYLLQSHGICRNELFLSNALTDNDDFDLIIESKTFAKNIKKEVIRVIDFFLF